MPRLLLLFVTALAAWFYAVSGDAARTAVLVIVPAVSLVLAWIVIRDCRTRNDSTSHGKTTHG